MVRGAQGVVFVIGVTTAGGRLGRIGVHGKQNPVAGEDAEEDSDRSFTTVSSSELGTTVIAALSDRILSGRELLFIIPSN